MSLVTDGVLLGEIEDARHVLHFALRHLKNLLEGDDFIACDNAVCLGHLGAKGDYANGEGNLMLRVAVAIVVENVAETTHVRFCGSPSRGTRQSFPDRHLSSAFRG